MKKDVELKKVNYRTKAFIKDDPIKTIPKKFVPIIEKLGYIDIRVDNQTLSAEERILLIIYYELGKYKDISNFKGLEEIVIDHKNYIRMRYGFDYYTVSIKDGPEVRVGYDEWNNLKVEEKEIKRWA